MNTKVKGIIAILISAIGFSFMAVFFVYPAIYPYFKNHSLEIS